MEGGIALINGIFDSLRKKDGESERIIFEMFYQRIYNIALFMTKDRNLAQDVVQETFFKAFKQLHTLKDGNKLEAWLASIASKTALDFLRKQKRWNKITTENIYLDELVSKNQFEPSVEMIVEERFLKNLLRQEISELKPDHKQVIILKYGYELKDEEIASVLEINVGTVKSRINRAKLALKASLEKQMSSKDGDSYGENPNAEFR